MKKVLGILLSAAMLICNLPSFYAAAADDTAAYYQERIDFYDGFDIKDPQYIEDEDFFGVYDTETNSWSRGPYFDYELFPELAEVENAAKMGDYELCREEILKYYRSYFKTIEYNFGSGRTSRCYRLVGEMIMEGLRVDSTAALPMGRVTLTAEPKPYEIDISEALREDRNKQSVTMSVGVQDIKKDGYRGVFYSIGSENEPYIELIVNGAKRIYKPLADKTLYPDARVNEKHTGEGFIYANESYTSINPDKNCIPPESLIGKTKSEIESYRVNTAFKPVDKYTARGYLRFDFSDIGATDKVSGGTLYLWGYMEEDDNPVRPEEQKDEIDVFIMDDRVRLWTSDASWAASGTDAVFSYDGEFGGTISTPVPATSGKWDTYVITNPSAEPNTLAQLYVGTGNEVYAYHAIRLLINSVLKMDRNLPVITQEDLFVAVHSNRFLKVLFPLLDSEHMTPEYFTMILKHLHISLDYNVSGWKTNHEGANGGSLNVQALLEVGMTFRQFKRYRDPLEGIRDPAIGGSMQGGWLQVGLFRSKYKINKTILEGGTPVEVPFSYVDTNVAALYAPYSWAEKNLGIGNEIRENIDDELAGLFKAAARYVIDLSNPIGGSWRNGDDNRQNVRIGGGLAGYARFFSSEKDPVIEWAYSDGASGNPPQEYTSFVNNDVNRLTLRSSWAKDAVAIYMDADGGWRNHAHNDDLAVNLMAYGKFMLYDPLVNSYDGQPRLVNWQRSTKAHNTIEINDVSQKGFVYSGKQTGPNGEIMYYPTVQSYTKATTAENDIRPISDLNSEKEYLGEYFDYVSGNTGGYIDNEWLDGDFETRRDILFIKPGYFIVTDYINPENKDRENSYTQNWHINPEMVYEIEAETKNIVSKDEVGANIIVAPVGGEDVNAVQRKGYYSPRGANNTTMLEGLYTSYDKTQKGTVTYNTVIYPLAPGESKHITTEKLSLDISEDKANAFLAIIEDEASGELKNISYYTLFDENEKAERKFGSYKTDASLAFVENNGESYPAFFIKNGKSLSVSGGVTLVENVNEIKNLAVKVEGNSLKIETDEKEKLDYTGLKVYCKNAVTSVTVNDESVYFEQRGGYVYFTQTGLPEDSADDTENKEPVHSSVSSTPSTSSGGSSGGSGKDDADEKEPQKEENGSDTITVKFTDTDNHWAQEYIEEAARRKIVTGDENGNFNPDNFITRAEIVAMLMRTLPNETQYSGEFSDVEESDWYSSYIAKAIKYNIISPDVFFRPNDFITREEMCKMVVNTAAVLREGSFSQTETEFTDKEEISLWALEYVQKAVSMKLMNGHSDGSFEPRGNATRAQAAAVICRMLNEKAQ